MLSAVKQQGEVLTAFHLDLARKLESGLVHQMSPELAEMYRPDDKSISVMVGSQKVRMRVKPTMDEDYLDDHAFVLRTIDRDGNGQWNNNRALTLFVHLFYLARASEYDVCEIIRWQLYRQGFSAVRVILRPFVMTDVEIGEARTVVRKRLPSRWQFTTEEIVIVPNLQQSIHANLLRHEFTLFAGHLPALPTASSQRCCRQ
jgi:hypothetical protein